MTDLATTAFLADIIAHPDADDLRLIYADWLQEHGQEARGEFIRVQIELAGQCNCKSMLCAVCKGLVDLRRNERELLNQAGPDGLCNWLTWARPVPTGIACQHGAVVFCRGFVAKIHCTVGTWCGAECGRCENGSGRRVGLADEPPRVACHVCRGTGRTGAHGPALVRAAPLERVMLSDRRPYHARYLGNRYGWADEGDAVARSWHVDPLNVLPHAIHALLPEPDYVAPPVGLWASEQRAQDAASVALLLWARSVTPPPSRP